MKKLEEEKNLESDGTRMEWDKRKENGISKEDLDKKIWVHVWKEIDFKARIMSSSTHIYIHAYTYASTLSVVYI